MGGGEGRRDGRWGGGHSGCNHSIQKAEPKGLQEIWGGFEPHRKTVSKTTQTTHTHKKAIQEYLLFTRTKILDAYYAVK